MEEFDNPVYEGDEFEDNEETPFIDNRDDVLEWEDFPQAQSLGEEIETVENNKAREDFYKYVESLGYKEIDKDAFLRNNALFETRNERGRKHIYVKYDGKDYKLTKSTGEPGFLSLSSIVSKHGITLVRDVLGVNDYSVGVRPKIHHREAAALNQVRDNTPAANDDVPLLDLSDKIDDIHESIENMREVSIETDITYTSQEWRDIIALDKTLQTQKGQINSLISKMAVIDMKIEELSSGAADDITSDDIEETRKKIAELRETRNQYNELVSTYESKIRSQFSRIRETISRMLYQDETLVEKIRTLFREQGVTIASLITAIGMTISAIVEGILLATRAGVTPKPKPPGPSPKPGPQPGPIPPPPKPKTWEDWVKDQLKKIANLLLKLGDKVIAALPGILGAVVSFVLKSASAAVGFLAEHLVVLAIAVGGIIYKYVNDKKVR